MTTRLALIMFFGLFTATALFGDNPKDDVNARHSKKLEGTWTGEWFVEGGKKYRFSDDDLWYTITFKGDSITCQSGFKGESINCQSGVAGKTGPMAKGRFKLGATMVPHLIDISVLEGKAKTITHAIYAFEGETLKLCISSRKRPSEFTSTAENENTLMLFKRSR